MTDHPPPIRLACLDLAGTLVADEAGPGGGLVGRAFASALDAAGVPALGLERQRMLQVVHTTMGASKLAVFHRLFDEPGRAETANRAFEAAYDELVEQGLAVPLPGAEATVRALRDAGTRVCLVTGFAPTSRDHLLHALGWEGIADVVLSPQDAGRGRPHPDLVLTAVLRLQIDDVREVAVAGDTASDIETGRRAGASVLAGVLTGAHDRATLLAAGATHVLASIGELPAVLGLPG